MSSEPAAVSTPAAPDAVSKPSPTAASNETAIAAVWKGLKNDREKYEQLKLLKVPNHDDISLSDCYDRAVQLSQYFSSFYAALMVLQRRIPKDDTQLWRVTQAFVEAVDKGLVDFWTAMNDDALDLLQNGKYTSFHRAITVPGNSDDTGVRPHGDPEDGVQRPVKPEAGVGNDNDDFVRIFIGAVNILCTHYPKLSEVGPKTGVSWAQVLKSVIEAGKGFHVQYTGKKGELQNRPLRLPAPQSPTPAVSMKSAGKKKRGGNGGHSML